MQVKQMRPENWYKLFKEHPPALSQVGIVQQRIKDGLPLASWEHAVLEAYKQIRSEEEQLAA